MPWEIRAENATVTFGSNYYTATDNETFPIGVYLNGDSKIGTYEVKISYDNRRLEYTGGGDSEENGVITLSQVICYAEIRCNKLKTNALMQTKAFRAGNG